MKILEVGCAIIEKNGRLLIAQRKPGTHLGGYWEFPGGKCCSDETLESCLVREVKEELGIEIRLRKFLRKTQYVYPNRIVILNFCLCDWVGGAAARHDCLDFRWVEPTDLLHYRFPPADREMINELICKRTFYLNRIFQRKSGFFQNPFQWPF
jgi:mutator protein MutT